MNQRHEYSCHSTCQSIIYYTEYGGTYTRIGSRGTLQDLVDFANADKKKYISRSVRDSTPNYKCSKLKCFKMEHTFAKESSITKEIK